MLALIAGTGALPVAVAERLSQPYLVCALDGFAPSLPVDINFRLEHLGSFLAELKDRGIRQVCMAGAIRRPPIDPTAIDAATAPLVPQIQKALTSGDDGALRAVIAIFEDAGLEIVAAHQVASDLLPPAGVLTKAQPTPEHHQDAQAGDMALIDMGSADSGQACVLQGGNVLIREDANGTDHMLRRYAKLSHTPPVETPFDTLTDTVGDALGTVADWLSGPAAPQKALPLLMKGPKPNQDLRADMPVIGPGTAVAVIDAGLAGIVIEAGGVLVLELPEVIAALDAHAKFLWVRPRGTA